VGSVLDDYRRALSDPFFPHYSGLVFAVYSAECVGQARPRVHMTADACAIKAEINR